MTHSEFKILDSEWYKDTFSAYSKEFLEKWKDDLDDINPLDGIAFTLKKVEEQLDYYKNSANQGWAELTQVVRERDKRPLPKQINLCTDCNGTGVHEHYEGEDKGWDSIDCMTCWGKPDGRFK